MLRNRHAAQLIQVIDLAYFSTYSNVDSLLTLAELVRCYQPYNALELGAAYGASAVFMARALPEGAVLTTIDSFDIVFPMGPVTEEGLRETLINFNVDHLVRVVRGDTRKVHEHHDGAKFDFVFFDACHEEADLMAEFVSVEPLLADRATLVFDDSNVVPRTIKRISDGHPTTHFRMHHGMTVVEWSR